MSHNGPTEPIIGQIIRLYADVATVQIGDEKVTIPIRGKLFKEDPPAVGDRVELQGKKDHYVIAAVLPRRSVLARRAAGTRLKRQVLIANVDQVVVVFAAALPPPNVPMLDRFLVVAEANHLGARVVVNKIELAESIDDVRAMFEPVRKAGYPVHFTSVKQNVGLKELHEALIGKASVLTGPSGVGKSSLLNALYPGLNLRVGQVSAAYGTGRHTTVGGYLIQLPDGASVADTAGLREVGVWMVPPEELPDCFPEFRPYLDHCRFSDCAHMAEPGCAIHAAVATGDIDELRYQSYVQLREEAEATFPRW
ncbi:MAG TPA: ribosome small subunit-dependent GTPase A [Chloroflexia bacterium]|jgi:ribosome biogenesis GTPase